MSSPPELPVLLLSLCFHENNFEKRSFARLGRDVADPLIAYGIILTILTIDAARKIDTQGPICA
jgi:hypothetical protein